MTVFKRALLLLVFFLAFLPAASFADLVIGANLGKSLSSELELEWDSDGFKETHDLDIRSTMISVGYKNTKNNRFLVSLDNLNVKLSDGGYSSKATGIRLDWQFVYT